MAEVYPLTGLYLYLTGGCNLKCRHCWLSPPHDPDGTRYPVMDFEIIKSVISQGKELGLKKVKLTGGEPLLHGKIEEIVDFIDSSGLKLTMETNGTLLSDEICRRIAKTKKPHVSVSLDGAVAKTHDLIRGVDGAFDKAVQGINSLTAAGLKPQIIMTIMEENHTQVEEMIQLAMMLGAGSVKFNLVQPASRGEKMHKTGQTLKVSDLIELGRMVEEEFSARYPIKLYYTYPQAFRSLGRIFDDGDCSVCGILQILGVLPDGSYALCGVGSVIKEMIFGHAKKDSLKEVWENSPVLRELREGIPEKLEGICGECLMKHVCRGGCIAQNYYSSKNLWAPFWFCRQAEKEGLFPSTRKIPV